MKKTGPKPRYGTSSVILVAAKLNAPEVKAMRSAMKSQGIQTQSRFISHAVRAFVAQCGIQIPDEDPLQLPLLPKSR
jgi:hypothetical protein